MFNAIAQFLNDNDIAVFNTTNETLNQIYIGQIDLSKTQCIGLYSDATVTEVRNIGISEEYEELGLTILVRWSSSYNTAYEKAKEIQDLIRLTDRFTEGDYTFWNFRNISGQPLYMGTRDDNHEFVLNYLFKINT